MSEASDFFDRVGIEKRDHMISQCAYPGCLRTLRHRFAYWAPPEGWTHMELEDGPILLCPEHAEYSEVLASEEMKNE